MATSTASNAGAAGSAARGEGRSRGGIPATVVLTATITPPAGTPELARTDPSQRMQDYLESLDYYLGLPDEYVGRLVFVENSASDVTPLRELAEARRGAKSVEFLSFQGLDHPPGHGRGYGEFKLLDYAVENSQTLRAAGDAGVWWKVTGRYRVLNLVRLIKTAPERYDVYCDMRDYWLPWMELGVFSCTVGAYRRLLMGVYHELREDERGESPEVVMRRLMQPHLGNGRVVPRFRVQPRVDGVRGRDNRSYVGGINGAKFWLRSAARKVVPWVWI